MSEKLLRDAIENAIVALRTGMPEYNLGDVIAILTDALAQPKADTPIQAHSKSEYKRLNAQGANVVPPTARERAARYVDQLSREPSGNEIIDIMLAFAADDRRDAERWRKLILHIGADEDERGRQDYVIRGMDDSRINLMQGSVAEHFTKAIDAERTGGK